MKAPAGVAALLALAGCGPKTVATGGAAWPPAPAGASLAAKVVWDFEHATLAGQAQFASLFDFAEVGAFEILLHRYDVIGRAELSDARRAALAAEAPAPYPAAREQRNVSRYYPRWVQRTVGTGGCAGQAPRLEYNQLMGRPFEPLPPEHAHFDALRTRVNAQLEGGGVIAVRCRGGKGGLALVYSPRPTARGYDLITIYDDGEE